LDTIPGGPPELANRPPGCAFAPRRVLAEDRCLREEPPRALSAGPDHQADWRRSEAAEPVI